MVAIAVEELLSKSSFGTLGRCWRTQFEARQHQPRAVDSPSPALSQALDDGFRILTEAPFRLPRYRSVFLPNEHFSGGGVAKSAGVSVAEAEPAAMPSSLSSSSRSPVFR